MKLLVLENEPIVAQALKLLLASVACEVEVVGVGEACDRSGALQRVLEHRYDLIVVDGEAEYGALGRSLGQRGQAQGQAPTPILLLTTAALVSPPWATATLLKPVDAMELIGRISALLGQPTAAISPVAELARSEARFRSMADYAPVMVWVSDATGHCTYLSRSWYEFTGQSEAASLGLGWLAAVHADDRASAKAAFLAATERQQEFRLEYRLRRRDGEYRWMLDAARPWLGVGGRFEGYIGSVLDISERMQTTLALQESEEKYRRLFSSIDEAFLIGEALRCADGSFDFLYTEVNPAFERVTGVARQQVIGQRARQVLPGLAEVWFDTVGRVGFGGEAVHLEEYAAPIDRWFSTSFKPVGTPGSGQLSVTFSDVTERKRLELSLKASEAKLSGILDSAIAAIASFRLYADGSWEHEYWSAGCEQLFGYPRRVYADRQFWLAQVHPDDRDRVIMPLFKDFFAGGQTTAEYRFRHQDGTLHWFHSDFASRNIAEGCWVVTSVNYDITERKQLERDRERFLAVGSDLQVITDRNGYFHWVSPTFEQALGWTVAEMTAIPWSDFVHPDDLAASADEITELFKGRDTFAFENRYRHRDGTYRWLLWKARLYPDDQRVYGGAIDITERKRSEASLRESEEKYRLLFNSMDEGFCVIEMLFAGDRPIDYRFLDINPTFAQQTGLVDAKGKRIRELVPNLETHWFEILGRVAVTGEPVRFEDYAAAMERWFDVFGFRFGAPELRQVAVLFRNVTERRRADAALKESERKLRAVFDSTFEFIGLLKTDGTVLDVNRTALNVIAATPEAVVGQPFWLTPWWNHFPEQRERLRLAIGRAAQGETVRMENQHIWADGSTAWVDFSIKPVLDEQGQVIMLVPEGRDITERKAAERKIREQAALLDIASDAITVRDLNHRLLYWNQGAERLYGFEAAEALGHKAYNLLHSEVAHHGEMMPTLLEQGEWRGELDKRTKTGRAITVATRWTLVNDEAGQAKFILSVETDITEKKTLEAQFYQAQRVESLGRLASGIAHDLNNVFTPIVTIAQLLRLTQRHLSDKAQDHLRLLEESAKRGASMVQQILSITRSSSGTRTEVNLGPLLQDLGNILQQSLPKHIDLRLPERSLAPDQALWVSADPTHLHQVLMNLCVNARDAMPTGGTLTISAELVTVDTALAQAHLDAQAGQYVRLTVADTGTGIDPDLCDRIFDPFFTTKAPGQGTGLGLATVLGIVKASDGFVRVVSEVGQGTHMQVYLPALPQPEASAAPAAPWPLAPQQGQGERLLIVEDDASVQHSVRSLLLSYNYSVVVANNGLEALDCYTSQPAHLVVVDMMMPGMDGITLIQQLKAMQPSVKIIATSGLPTYQAAALAAGASAFLLKPYDLSDLLDSIAAQLR
ncbi:PAS domain S-box protein [Nodosilinea sp. PGN35]|uniref:PAS domain S-box protein n=1 Tax=Nodosilinea sp. PGN35 TaxID=3020489 RepID=UPI0023B20D41|nr:PAS domain S-box protein [Nodosilinea sp. TSF1-S3]MDF0367958.1 PAS domain S-box protein [Nodosilinea sp. TSF1-S3]